MTAIPTDLASYAPLHAAGAAPDRPVPASDRLAAAVVAFVIAIAAFFAIGALAFGGLDALADHLRMGSELEQRNLNLASWMVYPLVHGWLLKTRGQTVGKWLLGIRIVRTDSSPAGLARLLLLRWLPVCLAGLLPYGAWVPLLDVLLIFRASRRCLHDQLAGTVVIRTGAAPPLW
jgi:uncharacterized RDD family membrane protein YckC